MCVGERDYSPPGLFAAQELDDDWSARPGRRVRALPGHGHAIRRAAVSARERAFLTAIDHADRSQRSWRETHHLVSRADDERHRIRRGAADGFQRAFDAPTPP